MRLSLDFHYTILACVEIVDHIAEITSLFNKSHERC